MSKKKNAVSSASLPMVRGEEMRFWETLILLARMMIKKILQTSAGCTLMGSRGISSQLRLPVSPEMPKNLRQPIKSTEKIINNSRRSAMMSTSTRVRTT